MTKQEFFNEEIRYGYRVDKEMKKVWSVEMDLLCKLIEVCKEQNIRVFVDAGTLLGTVRDHGFIPWDDDIDVCMLREDYERLSKVAGEVFEYPYFFQNYYTEGAYFRSHAQLRNSETTAILQNEMDKKYKFNQGIFIDIFILDGIPEKRLLLKKQLLEIKFLKKVLMKKVTECKDIKSLQGKILYFLTRPIPQKRVCQWIDKISSRYKTEDCGRVGPVNFMAEEFVKNPYTRIREKSIYENTLWLPFEYIEVPVPSGYESYLKKRYDNYMERKQTLNTHGDMILDTEKNYKNYL